MRTRRSPRSIKLVKEINEQLDHWAEKEGRSASNLAENLLKWSLSQLTIARHLGVLMEWKARPVDAKEVEQHKHSSERHKAS